MRIKKSIVFVFIILLSVNDAVAQLCQGSFGDPIVNITFGAGSNPAASLSAATTAYGYVLNDCPADGFYTVRNNSNDCFGSSWHSPHWRKRPLVPLKEPVINYSHLTYTECKAQADACAKKGELAEMLLPIRASTS